MPLIIILMSIAVAFDTFILSKLLFKEYKRDISKLDELDLIKTRITMLEDRYIEIRNKFGKY